MVNHVFEKIDSIVFSILIRLFISLYTAIFEIHLYKNCTIIQEMSTTTISKQLLSAELLNTTSPEGY